jgi:hypothetical protein
MESLGNLGALHGQIDKRPSITEFGIDSMRPINFNLGSQSPEEPYQKPVPETPRLGSFDSPQDRMLGDKQQEIIPKRSESLFSGNRSPTKIRLKSQDNGPSSNSININPKTMSSTTLNNVSAHCLKLNYPRSPGKQRPGTQSDNFDHADFPINPPRLADRTYHNSVSNIG